MFNKQNSKPPRTSHVPSAVRSASAEEMPCGHRMNGKNLIVCIDGTSNQFGKKNTNVIELYNLILKEVEDDQRTWYNSGIGTYARPSWKSLKYYKQALYHKIDLAIAWDFEKTVLAAYRWLSDNYEKGDCIFLFGFSRGAFQVRVLSAMIDKVGLIHKGNEMQIPFAYELYADPKSDELEDEVMQVGSEEKMSMAERFKRAFSYKDVKVHFVGAWDTVSSIGIARGKCMLPRTIDGMKHVCYFRHALALDERRVKFLPEYAFGGAAETPVKPEDEAARPSIINQGSSNKGNASPAEDKDGSIGGKENSAKPLEATKESMGKRPQTMEVWFAGTHSDIGGGNIENVGMDRSRPPLRWMVFEAGKVGLRMMRFKRNLSADEQIRFKESLTWQWRLFEVIPFKRLTFARQKDGTHTTHWPHLGSSRKIHPGQKIHGSLLLANKPRTEYTPKACPLNEDRSFWNGLDGEKPGEWLEFDLYEYAGILVERYIAELQDAPLQTLRQIATPGEGWQAVYEKVIEALSKRPGLKIDIKYRLVSAAVDILGKDFQNDPHFNLRPSIEIRPLVQDLWSSGDDVYKKAVQDFELLFTRRDPCLVIIHGHEDVIWSVAFWSDNKRIISASGDATIRIWDAMTGQPIGSPLQDQSGTSISISSDEKRLVSSLKDLTLRIWDVETWELVGKPFRGHTEPVRSLAFSSDGKHVVSGSIDQTVRIWDAETGQPVGHPFRGRSDVIRSVAFSPDGKRIVCSEYKTLRILDAKTGKPIGEPFRGHLDVVRSVAFSPDGKLVVSGSKDKTARIWNAETGKTVGNLQGHTEGIMSVAFSSDGKRVVSGSEDETIRIWDTETGKPVGRPFLGHTAWVTSVAFSSDSKHIVSGSWDKTVRIWDAEAFEFLTM